MAEKDCRRTKGKLFPTFGNCPNRLSANPHVQQTISACPAALRHISDTGQQAHTSKPDKNTAPTLSKSTKGGFLCLFIFLKPIFTLPLYSSRHFKPNLSLWKPCYKAFKTISAESLHCSSESCFVGFIFIHATGIWAHKLPSWFSATNSDRIYLIYFIASRPLALSVSIRV